MNLVNNVYPFEFFLYSVSLIQYQMSDSINCPKCNSEFTYPEQDHMVCSQCFHEWLAQSEVIETENTDKVLDSNGNELVDGDAVIVIKDLPVKGAPKPLKAGTKVKNIRLRNGDHNISCKIDGFGAMNLKSEFVKKA
jgi:protein PhnA